MKDEYYQRVNEIVRREKANRPPERPRRKSTGESFWSHNGKRIKKICFRVVGGLVLMLALGYGVDYGILQYRVAAKRNPTSQVTVQVYYAVRLKNGKTEYDFDQPKPVDCVNAVFPHLGMTPCWYLRRNPQKRVDFH